MMSVIISGNGTYHARERLKEKGFKWKPDKKHWIREYTDQEKFKAFDPDDLELEDCLAVKKRFHRVVWWREYKGDKPEGEQEGNREQRREGQREQIRRAVRITIPAWLARQHGVTRELEGHILRYSRRGVYFEGNATTGDFVRCARCGRALTNDVSRLIGIGPECCAKLGIDRSEYEQLARTEEGQEQLRQQIRQIRLEIWLPRNRVEIKYMD